MKPRPKNLSPADTPPHRFLKNANLISKNTNLVLWSLKNANWISKNTNLVLWSHRNANWISKNTNLVLWFLKKYNCIYKNTNLVVWSLKNANLICEILKTLIRNYTNTINPQLKHTTSWFILHPNERRRRKKIAFRLSKTRGNTVFKRTNMPKSLNLNSRISFLKNLNPGQNRLKNLSPADTPHPRGEGGYT